MAQRFPTRSPPRNALWAVLLAGLAAPARGEEAPAPPRGEEANPRLAHPTAVRAAYVLQTSVTFIPFPPAVLSAGVTVSRQVAAPLALEGELGFGGAEGHLGPVLGGALRFTPGQSPAAFTAALGTRAAFLSGYGTVLFANVEAGFAYRSRGGFDLVAAAGLGAPLITSRRVNTDCREAMLPCSDHFTRGQVSTVYRFEAGWAF